MIDKAEVLRRINFKDFYSEQIPSLKLNGKPDALGLCPFHDDHNPSLSVNIETGLYNCLSNCGAKGSVFDFYMQRHGVAFLAALKALAAIAGVTDTVTDKSKVVATFDYHNEDGSLLHKKDRIEPGKAGRQKDFFFHHTKDGKRIYQRNGNPVLYRLNEIIPAQEIYILEGEGKADLLHSWGLTATCLDSGSNSKWRDEYTEVFLGKDIIIVPDKDNPGTTYGRNIITNIKSVAAGIKLIDLPGTAEVNDILDWIKLPGNDRDAFLKIIADTQILKTTEEIAAGDIATPKNFPTTDLGNASRLVLQHGKTIRYCHASEKWFIWDGKRWRIDENGAIRRLAKETAMSIIQEAYKAGGEERLLKWATKSQNKPTLHAMECLARDEIEVLSSPDERDIDKYLLNCQNGTIDLHTGKIKPHNQKDNITKIIPTFYDQAATCPAWIDFLDIFFDGNGELINFIQRAVGYTLTGDTSEQALFIPYGIGENGKSTFIDTLALLLGDYGQASDVETFMVKKNDGGAKNDIARMKGARFISAVETEEGKQLSEAKIKQLTGGDMVAARFLFKEYFDFKPEVKIWLACNHKPVIKGTDHAIWRRIKLIPFNVKVPQEKKLSKEEVMAMFKKELPGILAWAVQGCLDWQKNGLQTPGEVCKATQEYRTEMDTVQAFIDDNCYTNHETAAMIKTESGKLFNAYHTYCIELGYIKDDIKSNRGFAKTLTSKGYAVNKSNGKRFTLGIGINTPEDF